MSGTRLLVCSTVRSSGSTTPAPPVINRCTRWPWSRACVVVGAIFWRTMPPPSYSRCGLTSGNWRNSSSVSVVETGRPGLRLDRSSPASVMAGLLVPRASRRRGDFSRLWRLALDDWPELVDLVRVHAERLAELAHHAHTRRVVAGLDGIDRRRR